MDLQERIAKVIAYTELPPSEFADEIEVQRSTISHITSGRNKPSLDFLIKIKNRFPELEWNWLIEGKGEMVEEDKKDTQPKKPEQITEPTTLPDLFSLINDEAFGITELEDRVAPKIVSESATRERRADNQEISDSQRLENNAQPEQIQNAGNQSNKITRIVFFYDNGKFETYEP